MPRGGPREGSGRPKKLDDLDRWTIGAECERRFKEKWEENTEALQTFWANRAGIAQVRFLQGKFHAATMSKGPEFLGSKEQLSLSSQIEKAIRSARRTPAIHPATNRVFDLPNAPRPKGVQDGICRAVAGEFSEKLKRPDICPRFVRRCWDEFRDLRKGFLSDTGMEC